MLRFKSIFIENPAVRMPGLSIIRVAVHRHAPKLTSLKPHTHPNSQMLLYLRGEGLQHFGNCTARVTAGTLVLIPSDVVHSFVRSGNRPPLCLMINFCFKRKDKVPIVRLLNRSEISRIRHCLAAMAKSHSSGALDCDGSVQVINMLLIAMRAGGWLKPLNPVQSPGKGRVVDQLLSKMELGDPLEGMIQKSGYGRDHLNRILKREVGLTLGQVRAKRRLELAERLLEQGMQVGAVAQEVGLPDSSYFTRWFRRQTGIVPTKWVSRKPGSIVVETKD